MPTNLSAMTRSTNSKVIRVRAGKECKTPASPARPAWMIRNVDSLVLQNGKQWRTLRDPGCRHSDEERARALQKLDSGISKGLKRKLKIDGSTNADCLIKCENLALWIEGKRFDWLSPGITCDTTRDQLARAAGAVWPVVSKREKDSRMID